MIQLDVTIMGHPYRLACKEGEERTLKEAVAFLDG
jgi:cell division protein ZapA